MEKRYVVGSPYDPDADAIVCINSDHHLVHKGRIFCTSVRKSIANGAKAFIEILTSSTETHLKAISYEIDQSKVLCTLWRAASLTNGETTAVANSSLNDRNTIGTDVLIYSGVTARTGGTQIFPQNLVIGGSGASRTGGVLNNDLERELKSNTSYTIELENVGALTADVNVTLYWYHPED